MARYSGQVAARLAHDPHRGHVHGLPPRGAEDPIVHGPGDVAGSPRAWRGLAAVRPEDRLEVDDRRAVDRLERTDADPPRLDGEDAHPVEPHRVGTVRRAGGEDARERASGISPRVDLEDRPVRLVEPGEDQRARPRTRARRRRSPPPAEARSTHPARPRRPASGRARGRGAPTARRPPVGGGGRMSLTVARQTGSSAHRKAWRRRASRRRCRRRGTAGPRGGSGRARRWRCPTRR